jgi:type I restriction-modification system DNA methylase subunit
MHWIAPSEKDDATGRFDFVLANPPFTKTFLGLQR